MEFELEDFHFIDFNYFILFLCKRQSNAQGSLMKLLSLN